MERLHQQLRESLHALVTSEDWRQALAVAARFHHYSFANTQLIWSQAEVRGFMPSRVAGYRTWQQLGRQVKRGERGIPILAPVTRKIEAPGGVEEEERRVVGFRVVHVFDISQTDGDPLPEIRAALVEGDLPAHWEGVAELITAAGFSLEVADVDRLGEANGITDWRDRMVVVRESLPGAQRFKTAVHELAHIRLHEPTSGSRSNCRGVVEVEAESVAYMVCAALGVDSTGYSLPYVAAWSGGDLDKVATTADRVMRCARRILDKVETEQDLARDRHSPEITAQDRHPSRTDKRLLDPVETAPGEDRYPELEEALRSAVAFYQARLDEREGAQARTFLDERRFTSDAVSRWQLGYAPASWDALVETLRSQGIPDEVLLEAGLAGRARTGRLYDRMRARIIFPIFDEQGSPRGFAGRLIAGEGPKYLNGPETPLYKKSALLYGLHIARPAISKQRHAVIVEGYTDAIAAHQAGMINTVATGGTALTAQHIEALRPAASTLILAFDGDQAGRQAAQRVAELPRPTVSGLNLQVARLPDGTDPADLLADGSRHLQNAITNPTPLLHYLLDHLVGQHDLDEPEALLRALRAAGPLIGHLTDSSDRALAVSYLAERVGRDENTVESILQRYPTGHRRDMHRSAGRTVT